ncbi:MULTISPECIES: DeoR/GlpR family DNA-binding transcription regulator [Paenibacillus]|uniref:DeoR/GlpR family DNA-binding transcription regulator n=1 Tax=Paenibacillus TaxID=44249 RepID=UPI0022B8A8C9|nr:DeoR/GlpR family DNA-binding transcription regulator [Paenibacillus caseinilyticus]MCZ8522542.1 DeoR/GlpR family DNA-binding transcription regulator [Paenibacillus caseinilyticus]
MTEYMFGEERKTKIMERLELEERVDVVELSQKLEVSESTVRRDLRELEEAGLLKRTHGGAVSNKIALKNGVNLEPSFREKEVQYQREKQAIARKAAELIREGDTVLLDSGTTTLYLLQELKAFRQLTVVTNAVISPLHLDHHPGIELIFLGGTFRPQTQSMVGLFTEQSLDLIRVDKCFIATNGVNLEQGLTTPTMAEAAIKRKMISCAQEVVLVTDSSKFGRSHFAKFAGLDQIHTCITDGGIPQNDIQSLQDRGITVVTADTDRTE